jgi:hypothetical protein
LADFDCKAYVYILTGPETFRTFDVCPPCSATSLIGGREEHSVSLPFEASGIFSLPDFDSSELTIPPQPEQARLQAETNGANQQLEFKGFSNYYYGSLPIHIWVVLEILFFPCFGNKLLTGVEMGYFCVFFYK